MGNEESDNNVEVFMTQQVSELKVQIGCDNESKEWHGKRASWRDKRAVIINRR